MGTWGDGIREDDFVCDVIGAFEQELKRGSTVLQATRSVTFRFRDAIEDVDEGPLFWIALAELQWTYGELTPQVLQKVKSDFDAKAGLERWQESSQQDLEKRCEVLDAFLKKIQQPNAAPERPPQFVEHKPIYLPGDCLAVKLSNGQYGAAFVLASNDSDPENGRNLIGEIDYLEPERPGLDVFQARRWLVLTHHSWKGKLSLSWYRSQGHEVVQSRIEVLWHLPLRDNEARDCNTFSPWKLLCEQVVHQRNWDEAQIRSENPKETSA